MRKINDTVAGRITNILNAGRGDSWNKSYGIFRPMKEWNTTDWMQYAVVTIAFTDGLLHLSTGMGIVDLVKASITMVKENVMTLKQNNSEEESVETVDVNFYEV